MPGLRPGSEGSSMAKTEPGNFDAAELARFRELASRWWDTDGELRTLHQMNPVRLALLEARVGLTDRDCLDVGCGGGLLTEALARTGARVVGIDLNEPALEVARMHSQQSGLPGIDYRYTSADSLAASQPESFDVVTCLEVIEHVPDPAALVAACGQLTRPGGHVVFSTINRSPLAFALAIVGAEYLLGLVPRGTHSYDRLVKPSELEAWGRQAGLRLESLAGLRYEPLTGGFRVSERVDVNYLAFFRRTGSDS